MFNPLFIGLALLAGVIATEKPNVEFPPESASLHQLENRLAEIDTELARLAPESLRSGVGSVGYESARHTSMDQTEWVEIDLGAEFSIDQIVVVPTLGRDSTTGLVSDGFPLDFRMITGTAQTTNLVASFTEQDHLLPRIAPLVVSFQPITASWVRIECTRLSAIHWLSHRYTLQLSELMIFSGRVNVALQKPVSASSSLGSTGRHKRFLVDGFVPYLMDAAKGKKSVAGAFRVQLGKSIPSLTIDLGESFPLNQINLHAIDSSHTVPEATTDDHAIPSKLFVTGANRPNFSDQKILFKYMRKSLVDSGPVIMRTIPETWCRYVRISAPTHQFERSANQARPYLGFAEIEIISGNQNVALHRPVIASSGLDKHPSRIKRITDGSNFYGKILSVRDWMNQLARRHDLETERPKVTAALSRRYAQQKSNLKWAIITVISLLVAGVVLVLVERLLRQRAVAKTRERIAANLHDELGANLHAIGILGTYAKRVLDSPEKLTQTVDKIKALTDRTGEATRYCTEMQTANEAHPILTDDLERTARRMIADIDCEFSIDGKELINRLPRRMRSDLYLFFKESLININRHADASAVKIKLTADAKNISLNISDNGCGITETEASPIPKSLTRRARLLRAAVTMSTPKMGGTQITLQFRSPRFQRRNRSKRY